MIERINCPSMAPPLNNFRPSVHRRMYCKPSSELNDRPYYEESVQLVSIFEELNNADRRRRWHLGGALFSLLFLRAIWRRLTGIPVVAAILSRLVLQFKLWIIEMILFEGVGRHAADREGLCWTGVSPADLQGSPLSPPLSLLLIRLTLNLLHLLAGCTIFLRLHNVMTYAYAL